MLLRLIHLERSVDGAGFVGCKTLNRVILLFFRQQIGVHGVIGEEDEGDDGSKHRYGADIILANCRKRDGRRVNLSGKIDIAKYARE